MSKGRWVLAVLGAVVLAAIGWAVGTRLHYQHQFDKRVAELKAEGFPVSMEDLQKAYVLPEGAANAADVYIEAFAHYMEPNETEKELLPYVGDFILDDDGQIPTDVLNAMVAFLNKNQTTVELLDKASTVEYCLWPRTRQECILWNENFRRMKEAIRLLQLRTLYFAEIKDTQNVYQSLKSVVALADAIQEQAFLIDHLVRIALKHLSIENLQVALNRTVLKGEQLTCLQKEFAEMVGLDDLYNALIIDRVFGIEFMPLSYEQQKKQHVGTPSRLAHFFYSATGLLVKDVYLLCFVQLDEQLEASKLPVARRSGAFRKIDAENERLFFFHFYMKNNVMPFRKLNDIDLRVIGSLHCAETALAVERYRLKNGALPESLEALVPEFMAEVPRDPFDNQPLRYVRDESGYSIYTIGADGVDNGGLSQEEARKQNGDKAPDEYDWPFTVNR